MKIPKSEDMEDGVVVKKQARDAAVVREDLNLEGDPLWVDMVGRTVIFAFPKKE